MLDYNRQLKLFSRKLRTNMTDAEQLLWKNIRRKRLRGVQFYRQKPIGNYIVDFYCPAAKLVIEINGGQHFSHDYLQKDKKRDEYLHDLNLTVLRFDNLQVLKSTGDVLEEIYRNIEIE